MQYSSSVFHGDPRYKKLWIKFTGSTNFKHKQKSAYILGWTSSVQGLSECATKNHSLTMF